LDVFDLSRRGIGLEFPAGDGPSEAGTRIDGSLRSAGEGEFRAYVECTNVRAHPDDEQLWIVGGRLTIADDEARLRYQDLIARLGP
jgi:hypothetical protein